MRKSPLKARQRESELSESNVKFTRDEALDFHARGRPGKIEIIASKPMATQRDLSLAYSPGVAVPVEEIAADPGKAYDLTAKGNLVAVISNGTAIVDRTPSPSRIPRSSISSASTRPSM